MSEEHWRLRPERPILGAGVVALAGAAVLLARRKTPPRQGQWSVPGGVVELGETLVQAAAREFSEETGLRAGALRFLETLDMIERDADGSVLRHYVVVDFWCEIAPAAPLAGDDATEAAWIERAALDGLGLPRRTKEVVDLAFARRDRANQP